MVRWVVLILLVAGLSGCQEEELTTYRISGSFTEDRTEDDMAELVDRASQHGDVSILESFPEQFVIRHLDVRGCQFLRPFLDTRDYIAQWRDCEEEPLGT